MALGNDLGAVQSRACSEKTELERIYESLYAIHLERLPRPEVGRECQVHFANGDTVTGVLTEAAAGRIAARLLHGVQQYPIDHVHVGDWPRFFPERVARQRALVDLRKTLLGLAEIRRPESTDAGPQAESSVDNSGVQPRVVARGVTSETASAPPNAVVTADGSDNARGPRLAASEPTGSASESSDRDTQRAPASLAPTPAPTPDDLKPAVAAFGQWLEYQHRRLGARVGEKVFAKREDGRVVLYLDVSGAFLAQHYDLRFQIAEGLWQFWAFRCQAFGVVVSPERAFIVLLASGDRIVGGSTAEVAANIWIEKNSKNAGTGNARVPDSATVR
ncbi:MAG: hypothetical protein A3K19_04565 [Lentisphaerae bacterium RIFOXYB12_FULL_65_16]|nr:MAG: hypothetical protein A3K18_01385 [Lentisphaerae bacterium RIFOXYA12_64_32]OGV84592.1 MAG: hypothetical protein A3K19_04565 [Lentisphaerae bacterium RIFOXYB12_FULL_65_16]